MQSLQRTYEIRGSDIVVFNGQQFDVIVMG